MASWKEFFDEERAKPYLALLLQTVKREYAEYKCHPDYENIWTAFTLTPLDQIKVVILGQDPYHNDHEAHGLAFSVLCEKIPPSLRNIYQEIANDLNQTVSQSGDLTYLAKQGVFLLNTVLTVRHKQPLSHRKIGWETFTDNTIQYINKHCEQVVFILWGSNAISKRNLITNPNHLILTSVHPSPLSAFNGFFGSKPFSKANQFLISKNQVPINWLNK